MMLLKFGREVDLNKLENISTNRIAEELKETISKKDSKYSRKLNEWEVCKDLNLRIWSNFGQYPQKQFQCQVLTEPYFRSR